METVGGETVTDGLGSLLGRAGRLVIIVFALIGAFASFQWAAERARAPRHFAKPSSFLILDIESSRGPESTTRIYLDSPTAANDLRFEGEKLSFKAEPRPHFQSSVPLPGYVVSGEGRIVFGAATINVKDGVVQLNGLDLCQREMVVSPSGESWQGPLRIAR
jgi:hypothetical protein